MKLDITQLVKTLDGKDFNQPTEQGARIYDDATGKDITRGSFVVGTPTYEPGMLPKKLTLQEALVAAVSNSYRGDEGFDMARKLSIHKLAAKLVRAETTVTLAAEEIVTLKERAAKAWGSILFGQIVALLEPEEPPTAALTEKPDA